jgi:DNA-binding SARP family transcriptional activator
MQYRIFGRLEALESGRAIPLGGRQQRALLALLLVERGRLVSVDRLVDELWGDRPPKAAVATVRVYVSQLRRLLGGEQALETRERSYLLHVEPGSSIPSSSSSTSPTRAG